MNKPSEPDFADPEFVALLEALVLRHATDEQLARLRAVLLADADKRRYAVRFLQDETLLRSEFQLLQRVDDFHRPAPAAPSEPPFPRRHRSNSRVTTWIWMLAASVVLGVGIGEFVGIGQGPQGRPIAGAPAEASRRVGLFDQGAGFEQTTGAVLAAGDPIRIGDVINFSRGVARLHFDCGAEVCLKAPATFKIISARRAALDHGTLTARVAESAHGFRIDTPNSKVIDLGTEFGLTFGDDGSTEMVVFSGKVTMEYTTARPGEPREPEVPPPLDQGKLLIEGEAMRVTARGAVERVMAVREEDFPRLTNGTVATPDWPPIIESVADNLRSDATSMCYRIVRHGFGEDARAFVDRPYQWNGLNAEYGLPKFLRGADYVMPFCDDKLSSELEVSITLNRPARLYVLIDDRVERPQWLIDRFEDTGYDVGVDESPTAASWLRLGVGPGVLVDKCFSIWSMDIARAATVRLGSMKSPQIQSLMYCIAAIPLEIARAIEPEPIRFHQARIGSGFITPALLPAPLAEARIERVETFADATVARPSTDDTAARKNGVAVRLETNGGMLLPHKLVRIENGTLPVLNDGEVSQNGDDLQRNVWYDRQGRFSVDLLRPRSIAEINTFSWHRFERAPQYFTVWGSNEPEMPATDFHEAIEAEGWNYIGLVKTAHLHDGRVHVSSLRQDNGPIGEFRYLLWITEFTGNGTFFTEIDVHAKPE